MSCRLEFEEYLDELGSEDIIFVSKLYSEKFMNYSETAFFKMIERMVIEGKLNRISKGMYLKYSTDTRSDAILNYYFGENNCNGMYIGYQLYNKYGISNSKSDVFELYSNVVEQEKKSVMNLAIRKINMELNYDNTRVIEAFEILQNYYKIENLNKNKLAIYIRQFGRGYNDEIAVKVLACMKYKKSTIAFMKNVLDLYEIENTLGRYLNCVSKYNIPQISKIF